MGQYWKEEDLALFVLEGAEWEIMELGEDHDFNNMAWQGSAQNTGHFIPS